jgi:hypothetical protein
MLYQTAGELPSPRVGHASALVSNVLIVWGGDTKTDPMSKPTDKQDEALYLLNLGLYRSHVQFVAQGSSSLVSVSGVDSGWNLWTCPCWSLWPFCEHDRLKILRLRRPGRWTILERHVGL